MLETFKNSKENELLNIKRGDMPVNAFRRKFKTLCNFTMNLDMSNEN